MDVVKRAWLWVCAPPIPLLIAMLIFGIALGGSLHSVEFRSAQSCVEQASIARAAGEPVFDCTWGDFIERWQELIGSLIALGAASVAAVPLYQQLREMNRQSQSVAVERLTRIVQSLEQERKESRDTSSTMVSLLRQLNRSARSSVGLTLPVAQIYDLYDTAIKLYTALDKHSSRNPQENVLAESRRQQISSINRVRVPLSNIRIKIRQNHMAGHVQTSVANIDLSTLALALNDWHKGRGAYDLHLEAEIARRWLRIRRLEEIAIGNEDV